MRAEVFGFRCARSTTTVEEEEKEESGRRLKFYVPVRDARTMLTSVLQITHCD
jgi:hypothetical protein